MDVVLGFFNSPLGAPTAIGLLAAAAAFVAVFPLRGGNGQHAGAGLGSVSVWQMRDTMQAAATRQPEVRERTVFEDMVAERCRAYLAERHRTLAAETPPYVGKHRLAIEDLVDEIYPPAIITLAPTAIHPY
ncbi:hypothetical protein AB0I53_00750 [Saccharopolyspora sp. NPDC050389]|uniref:hypothetical protein n=1 Tax=Saccharopolyspora sp. NPDC050389 TaxID=3155516 RepID=UPI0033F316E2